MLIKELQTICSSAQLEALLTGRSWRACSSLERRSRPRSPVVGNERRAEMGGGTGRQCGQWRAAGAGSGSESESAEPDDRAEIQSPRDAPVTFGAALVQVYEGI